MPSRYGWPHPWPVLRAGLRGCCVHTEPSIHIRQGAALSPGDHHHGKHQTHRTDNTQAHSNPYRLAGQASSHVARAMPSPLGQQLRGYGCGGGLPHTWHPTWSNHGRLRIASALHGTSPSSGRSPALSYVHMHLDHNVLNTKWDCCHTSPKASRPKRRYDHKQLTTCTQ